MSNGWQTQYQATARGFDQAAYDAGLRAFMQRVFTMMAAGLALTGAVAYFVGTSPALMATIWGSPLKWVVILAPLGMVFLLAGMIHRMSTATAQLVFWVYAALTGLSLSTIFVVYQLGSIAQVFFITSSVFLAAALWGYTTKSDLTRMGTFLFMGLIGIVIAGLVNLFVGSSMLQFIISCVGVIVFTGLTAWDTQNLKETYSEGYGHEATGKLAVMGALSLYMNFINLFVMMLQLLGNKNSE